MSENVSIREIAWRQYNVGRPASFFIRIVGILDLYELPPFTEVMNGHFKKIEWKGIVRERPFNLKGGGLCFFSKKIF
jgi:hypothetical protein